MGSANNIYVIPAPDKLTFNAGTLLSAACCIPAILLLIINWNKIRETNLKEKLFRDKLNQDASAPEGAQPDDTNNQLTGTVCEAGETSDQRTCNGQGGEQTDECVCNDNEVEHSRNRRTRNVVTTPIFGAAILSILAIGEWNFFSPQVQYQTEPMASIGQWAPIVGTGFALLGSLYVLLAKDIVLAKREVEQEKRDAEEAKKENQQQQQKTVASTEHDDSPGPSVLVSPQPTSADNATCERCRRALKSSNPSSEEMSRSHTILAILAAWRRKGSRKMLKVAEFVGTAAEGTFENKAFKSAKEKWILYPGEEKKNPALIDEEAQWGARVRSREFSRSSEVSPSRSGSMEPQSRNSILASSSTSQTEHRHSEATLPRSDTLQLPLPPSPVHHAPIKESSPPVSPTEVIIPGGQNNPALVVNDDGQLSRSETHPTPPAPAFRLWPFSSRRGTV
ncbi:hypothetical protein LTS07_006146 [Exophiala sideris]|uniref:Uncharacterized protein n=1 Tax=Exophiala sideris TaxID=1016849 RepID=A0ABR0J638_9EURO|nr:hypothetical protein LTS07_006146 [Exophiala sideris]KAK5035636.1 hypothetical protein LTR13_005765 [Exophiala sideris]KAK5057271.1 hypothetical protein LTR69_007310 [Exophiala sideris]